jgi:hypothetical protein
MRSSLHPSAGKKTTHRCQLSGTLLFLNLGPALRIFVLVNLRTGSYTMDSSQWFADRDEYPKKR